MTQTDKACARARAGLLAVAMVAAATVSLFVADGATTPTFAAKERVISFYNIHTKENITVVYKRSGVYVEKAIKKLNWFLRDWRASKGTRMDPRLFDLLADIHEELGSKRPIHVISGYRSPKTNAMLRRTRGGQARRSQHMLGRAIDVHFPDVSVRQLRYSALIREIGGVGYYPTSSIPFIHVDTGRVRHWPRMKRNELALLFPNGGTKHVPSDGRRITKRDARIARKQRPKLALAVASFHDLRRNGPQQTNPWATGTRTQIAAVQPPAEPTTPRALVRQRKPAPAPSASRTAKLPPVQPKAAPRLLQSPQLASLTPSTPTLRQLAALNPWATRTAKADRERLSGLASATSRIKLPSSEVREAARSVTASRAPDVARPSSQSSTIGGVPEDTDLADRSRYGSLQPAAEASWVPAPEFDEDHDEELFYSPFPVSPYLTDTASVDDDALVVMRHPDAAKSLAMLSEAGAQPMVHFVRGQSYGTVRTALAFQGAAISLTVALVPPAEPSAHSQSPRAIALR